MRAREIAPHSRSEYSLEEFGAALEPITAVRSAVLRIRYQKVKAEKPSHNRVPGAAATYPPRQYVRPID
jgi:hypothetical protein